MPSAPHPQRIGVTPRPSMGAARTLVGSPPANPTENVTSPWALPVAGMSERSATALKNGTSSHQGRIVPLRHPVACTELTQ